MSLRIKELYFEKSNVKSLEKKLRELIADEEFVNELKMGACQFITQKYNWDEIVDKTIQLYENVPVKESAKARKMRIRAAMADGAAEAKER